MTRYGKEAREAIKKTIVGKKVDDFYYEEGGDYYVITFDDGSETSVRLMADLV